jgi:hypothetical protein
MMGKAELAIKKHIRKVGKELITKWNVLGYPHSMQRELQGRIDGVKELLRRLEK